MNTIFTSIPHGAAVHLPLALAVLFPGFYWASWWTTSKRLMPDRIWSALWILSLIQLVTIGIALASGENAEFLSAGGQARIDRHELLAIGFSVLWVFTFVALSFSMWNEKLKTTLFHCLVSGILLGQLLLAVWTGHIGGSLR